MKNRLYDIITQGKANAKKAFAVLIDPDKINEQSLTQTIEIAVKSKVDYFFVGGSLVVTDTLDTVVASIKKQCNIPVILFPGSPDQITPKADALLYLSLISGRNAELLIGQHVISAPFVKKSGLEIISVGYMLIDGGSPTTVSYISNSNPIPANKNDYN
jgi:putative glycerol-1-phosphate prenyltransferase